MKAATIVNLAGRLLAVGFMGASLAGYGQGATNAPPYPGETIVASYTSLPINLGGGSNLSWFTAANCRKSYQNGPRPVTGLRVWEDNFWEVVGVVNGKDVYPAMWGNNFGFTNEVALEYPSNTFYRFTWNGSNCITMTGAQLPTPSDQNFAVTIPAYAQFWIRTFRSATNGALWPSGVILNCHNQTLGDGLELGTNGVLADKTVTGVITNAPNNTQAGGFTPVMITGLPAGADRQTASGGFVFADSIFAGIGNNEAFGFGDTICNEGLSNNVGFALFALPGCYLDQEVTNVYITNNATACASWVLHETKVNDFKSYDNGGAGESFSTVTNLLMQEWQQWTGLGLTVFETTCTPVTASTDGWRTLGNQTTDRNNAARVQFNTWLRTNQYPGVVCIDLAACCESSLNSGLWAVNGTANFLTGDGTHPSHTGSSYMMTNGWTSALQQVFQFTTSLPGLAFNEFNYVPGGGGAIFSGINGPSNGTYYVLATTNLALPIPQWTIIETNTFSPTGAFSVSNGLNTCSSFFIIEVPNN